MPRVKKAALRRKALKKAAAMNALNNQNSEQPAQSSESQPQTHERDQYEHIAQGTSMESSVNVEAQMSIIPQPEEIMECQGSDSVLPKQEIAENQGSESVIPQPKEIADSQGSESVTPKQEIVESEGNECAMSQHEETVENQDSESIPPEHKKNLENQSNESVISQQEEVARSQSNDSSKLAQEESIFVDIGQGDAVISNMASEMVTSVQDQGITKSELKAVDASNFQKDSVSNDSSMETSDKDKLCTDLPDESIESQHMEDPANAQSNAIVAVTLSVEDQSNTHKSVEPQVEEGLEAANGQSKIVLGEAPMEITEASGVLKRSVEDAIDEGDQCSKRMKLGGHKDEVNDLPLVSSEDTKDVISDNGSQVTKVSEGTSSGTESSTASATSTEKCLLQTPVQAQPTQKTMQSDSPPVPSESPSIPADIKPPDWILKIPAGSKIRFHEPPPAVVVAYCVFRSIRMLFKVGIARPSKELVSPIVQCMRSDFDKVMCGQVAQESNVISGEIVPDSENTEESCYDAPLKIQPSAGLKPAEWLLRIPPGGMIRFNSTPPAATVAYCVFKKIRMLFRVGISRPPKAVVSGIVEQMQQNWDQIMKQEVVAENKIQCGEEMKDGEQTDDGVNCASLEGIKPPEWLLQIPTGGTVYFDSPPSASAVAYCVFKKINMLFQTGICRPPRRDVSDIVTELQKNFDRITVEGETSEDSGKEISQQQAEKMENVERYLHEHPLGANVTTTIVDPKPAADIKPPNWLLEVPSGGKIRFKKAPSPSVVAYCVFKNIRMRFRKGVPRPSKYVVAAIVEAMKKDFGFIMEQEPKLDEDSPIDEESDDMDDDQDVNLTDYLHVKLGKPRPKHLTCRKCEDLVELPVILPCFHVLCKYKCAANMAVQGTLTCPKCREDHRFPDGIDLPISQLFQQQTLEFQKLGIGLTCLTNDLEKEYAHGDDSNEISIPKFLLCSCCEEISSKPLFLPRCHHAVCLDKCIPAIKKGHYVPCPDKDCNLGYYFKVFEPTIANQYHNLGVVLQNRKKTLQEKYDNVVCKIQDAVVDPETLPENEYSAWPKKLICPKCWHLFVEPLALPKCSHAVCKACIDAMYKEDQVVKCPLLRCNKSQGTDCKGSNNLSPSLIASEVQAYCEANPVDGPVHLKAPVPRPPQWLTTLEQGYKVLFKTQPPAHVVGYLIYKNIPVQFAPGVLKPPEYLSKKFALDYTQQNNEGIEVHTEQNLAEEENWGEAVNQKDAAGEESKHPAAIAPSGLLVKKDPEIAPPEMSQTYAPQGPPSGFPAPPYSAPPHPAYCAPPPPPSTVYSAPPQGYPGPAPQGYYGPPPNGPPPPFSGPPRPGYPPGPPHPMGRFPPMNRPLPPHPMGSYPPPPQNYPPHPMGSYPPQDHYRHPMGSYPPPPGVTPYGYPPASYPSTPGYPQYPPATENPNKSAHAKAQKEYEEKLEKWRQDYEEWFQKHSSKFGKGTTAASTAVSTPPPDKRPQAALAGEWKPTPTDSSDYTPTVSKAPRTYDGGSPPTTSKSNWLPQSSQQLTQKIVEPAELIFKEMKIDMKEDGIPRLSIENLPENIKSSVLKSIISKYGQVLSCKVGKGKQGMKAVAELQTEADASRIKQQLNYSSVEGHNIEISHYKVPLPLEGDPQGFLWIGNLPKGTRAADLKAFVEVYAPVNTCKVGFNKKENMTFGMLSMNCKADAIKSIKRIDKLAFNGMSLVAKRDG